MKTNWQIKKLVKMKVAWLIQWRCNSLNNEENCLKQLGIKQKIVDVVSGRKNLEHIIEIAKDIYKREMLSFSEKVYLSKSRKRKKEYFGRSIPVFTHYQSGLYRDLIKIMEEKGFNHPKVKDLLNKWSKHPQYVIVGYTPYLEVIKVFNLSVYKNKNGNEVAEWDRPLANGSFKREKYEFKK